ncbi:MAG TPA: hypothetical protein VFV92_02230 [Candidatus Bathyarchaeia archaeon]|nr:hypothetical protein [Candidatus Bathyarchaeia archaeon]
MSGRFPPSQSRKTETVSYRIRPDLKSALEEEARRLGINPNALVSQIFSRHISWGRYIGRLNFVPVSKDFLRFVFETLSGDDIGRIAKLLGESQAHEELLFLFQHISPGTVLMFMDLWASHFDAWDHKYDGGKHLYTIKHDVNLNFSFFTKEYVSSLIQSTLGAKVDFEAMSPNSVTFSFGSTLSHWRNEEIKPAPNRLNNNVANQTFQKKTAQY